MFLWHLFPSHVRLAHEKPLLGIDSGNNFISSRASNFQGVLPVSSKTYCLDYSPSIAPSTIARGFYLGAAADIEFIEISAWS